MPEILVEIISSNIFGWGETIGSPFGLVWFQVLEAIAVGLVGFLLGMCVKRIKPTVHTTGRWVWVLPAILLLIGVGWEWYDFGVKEVFEGFFFRVYPNGGEGPIGREIVTYPTLSTSCYALAMIMRWR